MENNQRDDWQACPPGAISGVADQLMREQRSQQVRTASTWAGGVLAIVLVGFAVTQWLPSGGSTPAYGGITCEACVVAMPDYEQHLVFAKPMTKPTIEQMQQHIADCKMCRGEFERRFPGVLADGIRLSGRLIAEQPLWARVLATTGGW